MFVVDLLVVLVAAKVAGLLSRRVGQPSVLGEILVGIIIGPSLLGLVSETEVLTAFGNLGVILLMLIIGLETDLKEFKQSAKTSTFVGFMGIVFPLLGGYVFGLLLGFGQLSSWLLGIMLSASSNSVAVQTLKELNQLRSKEGSTILGATIIDDILTMIILAFVVSILGVSKTSFLQSMLEKAIFFGVAFLLTWKAIPWLFHNIKVKFPNYSLITLALILTLLLAIVAEEVGVSMIIGAYIAGLAIGRTAAREEVHTKVETMGYSLFIPVFFTLIGMSAPLNGFWNYIGFIVLFSVLAILTKIVGAGLGSKLTGLSWGSSLRVGASMIPRGEVTLIVAELALAQSLISQTIYMSMIMVVVVTMLVTPPIMKFLYDERLVPVSSLV